MFCVVVGVDKSIKCILYSFYMIISQSVPGDEKKSDVEIVHKKLIIWTLIIFFSFRELRNRKQNSHWSQYCIIWKCVAVGKILWCSCFWLSVLCRPLSIQEPIITFCCLKSCDGLFTCARPSTQTIASHNISVNILNITVGFISNSLLKFYAQKFLSFTCT